METVNTLTKQEKDKIWRENNKDRIRESKKARYDKNKELMKETNKIYKENHKEQIKEQKKHFFIANKEKLCEMTKCECGGEFQLIGKYRHVKSLMHMKFMQEQELQDRLQEVEDIKEQEIRDNNAEVETWKAADLQREKEKAEEDARLDAAYEIWSEAQRACRLGYKNREEKAPDVIQKKDEACGSFTSEKGSLGKNKNKTTTHIRQ